LIGCNPTTIILVAPLLVDQENPMTLQSLYKAMTNQKILEIVKAEKIEDSMMQTLRLSMQISILSFHDTDPESVQLLYLLSMMPGGILAC
jgi:hypothetical protein